MGAVVTKLASAAPWRGKDVMPVSRPVTLKPPYGEHKSVRGWFME